MTYLPLLRSFDLPALGFAALPTTMLWALQLYRNRSGGTTIQFGLTATSGTQDLSKPGVRKIRYGYQAIGLLQAVWFSSSSFLIRNRSVAMMLFFERPSKLALFGTAGAFQS